MIARQAAGSSIETGSSASQIGGKVGSSEQDMIHMIAQSSSTFHITPSMFRME
jgi:hypothetical protein